MTRAALIRIAARWLRGTRTCDVVLARPASQRTPRIPDVIGWRGPHSVRVEVVVSRAGFQHHLTRRSRVHVGRERWYLAIQDLLDPAEIAAPWGLLEWSDGIVLRRKRAEPTPIDELSASCEVALLVKALTPRDQARPSAGRGRHAVGL